MDHRCTADIVEWKLNISNDDSSIVKEQIQIIGKHFLPPEDDAFVFDTVPGPDTKSAASEINKHSGGILTKL